MGQYGSKMFVEQRAFMPPSQKYPLHYYLGPEHFEVQFVHTSTHNVIPYIYLHAPIPTNLTIIFSHGNSTNLGQMMPLLLYYRQTLEVNIVSYDYTGYGHSHTDVPSEKNAFADILAVIKRVHQQHKIAYTDMVLFGKSLGSGPTSYAASKFPVKGVILESAFLSCLDIVFHKAVKEVLHSFNVFPNYRFIPLIKCPLLLIHGTEDCIVPVQHAHDLAKLSKTETITYYPKADHNNILIAEPVAYIETLQTFLEKPNK